MMNKVFDIGKFDLDVTLRDSALDPECRPTKRLLANASLGVEPFDAYYSARELYETLEGVFEGLPNAKKRLTQVLSCQCDDYQRCLYYVLAGRGVVQMLEDLEWLLSILAPRLKTSAELLRSGERPWPMINPYVAAAPDGVVPARNAPFTEGPSWYLDPGLGGIVGDG
ncbi:hypothetical protein [Erythrobacter sp. CCH5-A1]|jgi:hypothetical protein|uniref:hypothetical protein n=1 Tax=Erythrobacter sp. CCH5-A1 TaxID=1768792 RepID=UPI000B0E82A2